LGRKCKFITIKTANQDISKEKKFVSDSEEHSKGKDPDLLEEL